MKLLLLGGTKFLGRAAAEAALARGHELTLFTRGRTNPGLFPEAEHLHGDRDGDLRALERRGWDAVLDPSGYVPRVVRASAELLRDAVGHYVFVSSVSAFAPPFRPGYDEDAPAHGDPRGESVDEEYGELKAACERTLEEVLPGRVASVRAGLIVGPHDPTGRFTYWPRRIAAGGRVLAPGRPDRHVQFVDVRDLGAWLVELAERRAGGVFTATGPVPPVTMGGLLEAALRVTGSGAELVWVDEPFLLEQGVGPWMELPLWLPESDQDFAHMLEADVSRAIAAGLRFRPLEETLRDTLAWAEAAAQTAAPLASGASLGKAGLEPERERELLAAWRG